MGPIEQVKNGMTLGDCLAYEASRGRSASAQATALERAHERWGGSRRLTIDGMTGMIAELVEHLQSPVHVTTARRRVAAGMSLCDALITPRQQPKPRHRDSWKRSRQ